AVTTAAANAGTAAHPARSAVPTISAIAAGAAGAAACVGRTGRADDAIPAASQQRETEDTGSPTWHRFLPVAGHLAPPAPARPQRCYEVVGCHSCQPKKTF